MSEREPRSSAPGRDTLSAPKPAAKGALPNRSGGISNQVVQAEINSGAGRRLGLSPRDVEMVDGGEAAAGLGARGASSGAGVSLGPGANRATLAHELVHVAQARRFGTGPAGASRRSDAAEREARLLTPLVLGEGGPVEVRERPAARWNLDPMPGALAEEPAQTDPGWSFDPYAESIAGLGNQDLVLRTLAVREWLKGHSLIELDYEANLILRDRLDIERDYRIDLGHLWLEDIDQGASQPLIRLMTGANGAIDVVSVTDGALLFGGAVDLSSQPVMSLTQFNAFLARNGIGQMSLAQYLRDTATSRPGDPLAPAPGEPSPSASPLGYTAGASLLSPRDLRLPMAFANQGAAGRQGALSELFYSTSRQALYGFGVVDQNAIQPSHPRTDFRQLFGDRLDLSLKSRVPGTDAAMSANPAERYANYLEGHAKLYGTQPGYTGFDRFMQISGGGRTPAQVRAQSGMVVDANDFAGYRAFVADPLSSGATTDLPLYLSRIYDGVLQDRPIAVGDGGPNIRTVAELDAALTSGRIGIMQHTAMLNGVAAQAGAQVQPNIGFGASQAQNFHQAFAAMHPSLRPEPPAGSAPLFTATRDQGAARAQSASRIEQFRSYLTNQTAMLSQNGDLLRIAPADVSAYQALLREPFARETTPAGGDSRLHNYRRADVKAVYDAVLARTPVAAQSGEAFQSVSALDEALKQHRLSVREHYQLLDRVGRMAARTVVADVPTAQSAGQQAANARYAAERARANEFIRRAAAPEYMHSVANGGGWRGDAHAARSYGGKGALLGALFGMGRQAWDDRGRGLDATDIAMAGGREGLRGGLSATVETVAVSRASQYMLREGLELSAGKALAMRAGSRFAPGLVDLGFEFYDMATDKRENSAGEIAYRSSRALVVGGSSAAVGYLAGAAAGAAAGSVVPGIGTAVGFIVGLGVGLVASGVVGSIWDSIFGPSEPRPDPNVHTMFRSMYNAKYAGRCPPNHHQKFIILEDPPEWSAKAGTPSLFQMAPITDPADPRARPDPMAGWNQLSEADRKALSDWISTAQ